MQKFILKDRVKFVDGGLAATANGTNYSSSFNQEDGTNHAKRPRAGLFLIRLPGTINSTVITLDVQHSDTDGSYVDAVRSTITDEDLAEVQVVAVDTYLAYHIPLDELKQYYRLKCTADGVDNIECTLMLYDFEFTPL